MAHVAAGELKLQQARDNLLRRLIMQVTGLEALRQGFAARRAGRFAHRRAKSCVLFIDSAFNPVAHANNYAQTVLQLDGIASVD